MTSTGSTVVGFAGDWHGDTAWAVQQVRDLGDRGVRVLCHVGDFGIWPGPTGRRYLQAVEQACAEHGVTMLVTPGNHEDWDQIAATVPRDLGDGWGAVRHLSDGVKVLPRGHRFTLTTAAGAARSFVSLGGAPSIDFEYRREGRDWWPAEMITDADVDATVAGGHADVMIAHDSPDVPYAVGEVAAILASNPMGWSQQALAYAAVGRKRMHRAYEGVAPTWFFHGHYHVAGIRQVHDDTTPAVTAAQGQAWVVALDQQRTAGNVACLDLDSLDLV